MAETTPDAELSYSHVREYPNYWPICNDLPLRARIFESGFMIAESAVIGRLSGCMGMAMSIITTLFDGAVSLTQMYLSDSIVTCVKEMNCWFTPSVVSCKQSHRTENRSEFLTRSARIRAMKIPLDR